MKHKTSTKTLQCLKLLSLMLSLFILSACQGHEPTPQFNSTIEQYDESFGGRVEEITMNGITLEVEVIDGKAIFEGDMILGDIATLRSGELSPQGITIDPSCTFIFCHDYKWPNGEIPFVINSNLSTTMRNRVNSAIQHWEANTQINFIAKEWYHGDYVEFRSGSGCSANVGRIGGQQFVNLASSCTTGSIIHEIGHSVGLFHEHTRCDRNSFVSIRWDRIPDDKEPNFSRHCSDATDRGSYDFGSIMHYSPTAFSSNGLPTIECALTTCPTFGQRTGLSTRDRQTVNNWY